MSQLNVRNALATRLAAFATANGNIPIVWENIKTIPTVTHLRAILFPSPTQDPSFGNKHVRYAGLFRVTYYTTALNVGMKDAEEFVDALIKHFPRGQELVNGSLTTRILNTASVSMPMYEGNFMVISIQIPYMADEITA